MRTITPRTVQMIYPFLLRLGCRRVIHSNSSSRSGGVHWPTLYSVPLMHSRASLVPSEGTGQIRIASQLSAASILRLGPGSVIILQVSISRRYAFSTTRLAVLCALHEHAPVRMWLGEVIREFYSTSRSETIGITSCVQSVVIFLSLNLSFKTETVNGMGHCAVTHTTETKTGSSSVTSPLDLNYCW
jgi:hypothetical protein